MRAQTAASDASCNTADARRQRSATIFAARRARVYVWLTLLASTGCTGVQSALDPSGPAAEQISNLFWVMTGGSAVIYVAFVGLAVYAVYVRRRQHSMTLARRLIIWGAVIVPALLLAVLLVYGLQMLPAHLAPAPEHSLRIHVHGHQWWWRVRYEPPGGEPFETANEIHLPLNEPVQFVLESPDVIHSFWIPNLAGKVDMIPGRTTRLALTPTRAGVYRGQCAEYCGTSHAWMAFPVVVEEKRTFTSWLAGQTAPASNTVNPAVLPGRTAFVENGCGACHTIRGTTARGVIGPDLTHVGGRLSVGAGLFARSKETLERWISHTDEVKPGVHMPAFGMLPPTTLGELSAYLESLK